MVERKQMSEMNTKSITILVTIRANNKTSLHAHKLLNKIGRYAHSGFISER